MLWYIIHGKIAVKFQYYCTKIFGGNKIRVSDKTLTESKNNDLTFQVSRDCKTII